MLLGIRKLNRKYELKNVVFSKESAEDDWEKCYIARIVDVFGTPNYRILQNAHCPCQSFKRNGVKPPVEKVRLGERETWRWNSGSVHSVLVHFLSSEVTNEAPLTFHPRQHLGLSHLSLPPPFLLFLLNPTPLLPLAWRLKEEPGNKAGESWGGNIQGGC